LQPARQPRRDAAVQRLRRAGRFALCGHGPAQELLTMPADAAARPLPVRRRIDRVAASKPLAFALCLLPLAWLAWDALHGRLGPDPVAQLEHRSGLWALRLLLATLAVTPLRRLTSWHWLVRYRRMLGL